MSTQMIYMLIGSGLLLWVGYDLFSGTVYLHRAVERSSEPGLYWGGIALWTVVALSFFIY